MDNLEKREPKGDNFPMAAVFMAMMIGILSGLVQRLLYMGREPENS